jgi:hypothetical protein
MSFFLTMPDAFRPSRPLGRTWVDTGQLSSLPLATAVSQYLSQMAIQFDGTLVGQIKPAVIKAAQQSHWESLLR